MADFALPSFLEGSNRCGSTREFTFIDRTAATVSCAKSARCSVQILFTIENTRSESALLFGNLEEIRLHQFRDRGVFVVACTSLQTGHGRPECVDAIVHGRKIGICGDGIFHKLLSQGVVLLRRNEYINLYNYYARALLFRHSSVVRWIVFVIPAQSYAVAPIL